MDNTDAQSTEWSWVEVSNGALARKFFYRPGSSDERVVREVLRDGEYNFSRLRRGVELKTFYEGILLGGRTPLIVDAGANIGASAIWFHLSFPQAKIVAIEPELANFELLRANTDGAPVETLNGALVGRPGSVWLEDPGAGSWGFRTSSKETGASLAEVRGVTVGDLYELNAGACAPFIVKIDIEGGEAAVFAENTDWVPKTPVIAIELHDWILTGQANSRAFLQCVSALDRDFVYVGENVFSISNDLDRLSVGPPRKPA